MDDDDDNQHHGLDMVTVIHTATKSQMTLRADRVQRHHVAHQGVVDPLVLSLDCRLGLVC